MVGKAFEKKIEKRRLMFKNIYIEFIFTLLTLFPHKMSVAIGFDDVIYKIQKLLCRYRSQDGI